MGGNEPHDPPLDLLPRVTSELLSSGGLGLGDDLGASNKFSSMLCEPFRAGDRRVTIRSHSERAKSRRERGKRSSEKRRTGEDERRGVSEGGTGL